MSKILIWNDFVLRNTGGPSGYLYNLHSFLELHPESSIFFLSDIAAEEGFDIYPTQIRTFDEKRGLFKRIVRVIEKGYHYAFGVWREKMPHYGLNINRFDYVHIHRVPDIIRFRRAYPEFSGKVILTSHCPSAFVDEQLTSPFIRFLRPLALHNECRNYKSADYLMFPCAESREPYEKNLQIRRIFKHHERKFKYVPSAILDFTPKISVKKLFTDIGIPDDAFVITFFGRHNEVKGYDVLKRIGLKLLEKHENLCFLCGGTGPVSAPSHPRWIELGFITNVADYLWGSDLSVVPNKDTYFDLAVLEILRSGTRVLLSDNGGNRYFKHLPQDMTSGISYFGDDEDDLCNKISAFIEMKTSDSISYEEGRRMNRELFKKFFSMDSYIKTYASAFGIDYSRV